MSLEPEFRGSACAYTGNLRGIRQFGATFPHMETIRTTTATTFNVLRFKARANYINLRITFWMTTSDPNFVSSFMYSVSSHPITTADWTVWNIHEAVASGNINFVQYVMTPFTIVLGNVPLNNVINFRLYNSGHNYIGMYSYDWSWA